ncbi:MAG: LptF/LptG family permease [Bradyrhizobium sp.]|nr:LptF/LptG family permease [Bradyrhizobium sp.]
MQKILAEAAIVGDATARAIMYRWRGADGYWYSDRNWRLGFVGGYKFEENGARLLNAYSGFFFYATGVTPAMDSRSVGEGSQYLAMFVDAKKTVLDGGKNYRLHLPPNIPIKNFWSVIVYDNQTRSMLQTDQRFPSVSSQNKKLKINPDGSVIINAARSEQQGVRLTGLTLFRFDTEKHFKDRIEAREATLEDGQWVFKSVRRFSLDAPPVDEPTFILPTSLTPAQVRNSFSTPETVSFWQLPSYIRSSESSGFATAGYRLQYHKLIAQPFLLAAMVMLAASVSLRFFRMGGVQKMVLSGVGAGFLLYVLSKVTEDLSKAALMDPIVAAWLPVFVGGLTGFMALLYQEDG